MKYLMFIKHDEASRGLPIPKALNDAMGAFVEQGFKSGVLVQTDGLKATDKGFRIRSRGGKLTWTDGPFTEAKEVIGGFAIVDVKSNEEAREVARQFMEIHRVHWPEFECECECRPFDS